MTGRCRCGWRTLFTKVPWGIRQVHALVETAGQLIVGGDTDLALNLLGRRVQVLVG